MVCLGNVTYRQPHCVAASAYIWTSFLYKWIRLWSRFTSFPFDAASSRKSPTQQAKVWQAIVLAICGLLVYVCCICNMRCHPLVYVEERSSVWCGKLSRQDSSYEKHRASIACSHLRFDCHRDTPLYQQLTASRSSGGLRTYRHNGCPVWLIFADKPFDWKCAAFRYAYAPVQEWEKLWFIIRFFFEVFGKCRVRKGFLGCNTSWNIQQFCQQQFAFLYPFQWFELSDWAPSISGTQSLPPSPYRASGTANMWGIRSELQMLWFLGWSDVGITWLVC